MIHSHAVFREPGETAAGSSPVGSYHARKPPVIGESGSQYRPKGSDPPKFENKV
jgi:hypothetical protein